MTNIRRPVAAPGVALTGDAAMSADPVWGWRCGWALKSSTLLAEATIPALRTGTGIEPALRRYRTRHFRELAPSFYLAASYSTGRRFTPFERIVFAAAARDDAIARAVHAYVTTSSGRAPLLAPRSALRCLRAYASSRGAAAPAPLPSLRQERCTAAASNAGDNARVRRHRTVRTPSVAGVAAAR